MTAKLSTSRSTCSDFSAIWPRMVESHSWTAVGLTSPTGTSPHAGSTCLRHLDMYWSKLCGLSLSPRLPGLGSRLYASTRASASGSQYSSKHCRTVGAGASAEWSTRTRASSSSASRRVPRTVLDRLA